MEFKDKKAAVVGAGVEGMSSVKFLMGRGAEVTVLDRREIGEIRGIRVIGGEDYLKNIDQYDIVVRSPGVKRNLPEIVDAEKSGVAITSQTKIFFDLCPCPIIGVTGTKGKGTTASLIWEMFKAEGLDTYLGGNIGVPPLDFLDKLNKDSWVVLELSSFQLLDLGSEVNFGKPHIAVMLMVVPEHLNYHADINEYVEAKRNILKFQSSSDFAILNRDYPASNESDIDTEGKVFYVSRERKVEEGCFVKNATIVLRTRLTHVLRDARQPFVAKKRNMPSSLSESRLPAQKRKLEKGEQATFSSLKNDQARPYLIEEKVIAVKEILLPGKHNLENVCASVMAATLAGVEKVNIAKVLKTFKGLEHRLELVGEVNGVKYYDDSFSTTPETAIAAIQAFKQPEILILGGSSKGSDFTELGRVIRDAENVKAIIGIGEEWERIKSKIKDQRSKIKINEKAINFQFSIYEGLKDMREIVQKASRIANAGDIVLLSPACASFDMFKNYKDRGEQFKEQVEKIKDQRSKIKN